MFTASQKTADAEIKNYQLELEMDQRNQAEQLNQVLFNISNAINTTQNLDDLYASIHNIMSAVLTMNNFYIALYHKNQDRISFPYYIDETGDTFEEISDINKKRSFTIEVIRSAKPLLITKKDLLPGGKYEGMEQMGAVSAAWLGVPLKIESEVIGAMVTQSYTDPDRFSHTDINLLVTASDQVALAIERKKAQEALLQSEIKHRSIIESVKDGYCETDPEGRIVFFNEALCAITGFSADALNGMLFTNLLADKSETDHPFSALETDKKEVETSLTISRRNGRLKHIGIRPTAIRDEDGRPTGYRTFVRDIDEQKQYEEKLVFLAYHDPLTGLNNRKGFYEYLKNVVKQARRNASRLAVIYMDIDKFKQVNDTLGHEIGDELLKTIAHRLQDSLRETDFISRIGGDEFTIVMTNDTSFHPNKLAVKIGNAIRFPYDLSGHTIDYVSASIGISIYPDDNAKDIEDLVKKADMAMYEAKKTRNTHIFYRDIADNRTDTK
jgi:diguanylate cyclase (GGDEF)-like protein/PAS domain S-box-containing protein